MSEVFAAKAVMNSVLYMISCIVKNLGSRIISTMISVLRKYFVLLPILYLFVAIFLLRSQVQYIYIAATMLVVLTIAVQYHSKVKPDIFLGRWMAVLGVIGISAAVILSIEKIELLSEPNHIASCSLSPIVACSPIIASPQASAFGFSNSFIGIFGFAAILTAAMTLLAGATKLHKLWWRTLLGGIIFGAGFCVWLFYQGVFDIGKLCLYCMLVWLVTFALLWLTTAHTIQAKYLTFGNTLNKLLIHKYELILGTYALIFMILFYRWSDYWLGLL
jgi:uncharacterized membrane protein